MMEKTDSTERVPQSSKVVQAPPGFANLNPGTKMMLADIILALSQHSVYYHKLRLNEGYSWIDFHIAQWT